MDIDGLGDAIIEQLIQEKMIANPADLYRLEPERLAALERLGEKSAANITAAVEASKGRSPARVVFALGIPHVGGENAELLMRRFGTITALIGVGFIILAVLVIWLIYRMVKGLLFWNDHKPMPL